jgi:uncharacterized membrane protein
MMSALQIVLLLIGVALLAAALVLFLRTQRSEAASGAPPEYQIFGPGVRDEDRYWLLNGFMYSNPDDPALFVINRWGIGITPNLAHPLAVRVAIGLLVALALIPIVLMLFFPGLRASGAGCHPFSGCHSSP